MAIWSLTQERVDKLLRQIGEKETEIDELIKLSKEDIWRRDLDEFINEWRFQLEDERRRERKVAGMGRRHSSKLMTAASKGPGRKRKNDDDDDDYAAPKSKKAATNKKAVAQGSLMSYLKTSSPKPKKIAQEDGADDDDMDLDDDFEAEIMPKKSRGAVKPKAVPKKEEEEVDDDFEVQPEALPKKSRETSKPPAAPEVDLKDQKEEDDDEDFVEVTATSRPASKKPAISKPAAKKAVAKEPKSRTTTKKPVSYVVSSESESEFDDDLLDDVSKMVKGIGDSNGKALISEFTKPGASAGLKKSTPRTSKINTEFDPDETDYSKLVPQSSPRRSLLVKQKEKTITDMMPTSLLSQPQRPNPPRKPRLRQAQLHQSLVDVQRKMLLHQLPRRLSPLPREGVKRRWLTIFLMMTLTLWQMTFLIPMAVLIWTTNLSRQDRHVELLLLRPKST